MAIYEDSSTGGYADAAEGGAPGGSPAPLPVDGQVNPAALTVEQLARMLAVPVEKIRDHVAAGAPLAADGRLNLVHFAAWLNRRLRQLDGD